MFNFLHIIFDKVAVLTAVVVITVTAPFHLTKPALSPTPSPIVNLSVSASTRPSSSQVPITPTVLPPVTTLSTGQCRSVNGLPDLNCTPGASDPRVTQDNIYQTICVSGYTTTVRPSTSYTDNLKIAQIKEYGYSDTNTRDYEEDHLIPLEVGGSPSDPKNLWPEPGGVPNPKDSVENSCHEQVCNGQISLGEAQKEIATDWRTACGSNSTSTSQSQATVVAPPLASDNSTSQQATTNQDCSNETALCNDGSCSNAATHRGACSHHGGVAQFYK